MLKNKKEKFQFPIPKDDSAWSLMTKNNIPKKNDTYDSFFSDEEEGELGIDVYQNEKEIIIKTAIAGVSKQDLEISLNRDMLTIRGNRKSDTDIKKENYFYQECYWGKFSRSLILPADVNSSKSKAQLKNGVLTIVLPKLAKDVGIIKVKEIE